MGINSYGNDRTDVPYIGKYQPSDGYVALDRDGDIVLHPAYNVQPGVVIRFSVPMTGSWQLHDAFLMPFYNPPARVGM
eukprot:2826907-Pleurochrysis_carterae.AAC.1